MKKEKHFVTGIFRNISKTMSSKENGVIKFTAGKMQTSQVALKERVKG